MSKPTITALPREDWKARPSALPLIPRKKTKFVIIHYYGANFNPKQKASPFLRGIQSWHIKHNGWRDIAYSHLIVSGKTYEGRGTDSTTGSTNRASINATGLAVMVRNYGGKLQRADAIALLRYLKEARAIFPKAKVVLHKEVNRKVKGRPSTICPGIPISQFIESWRSSGSKAEKRLNKKSSKLSVAIEKKNFKNKKVLKAETRLPRKSRFQVIRTKTTDSVLLGWLLFRKNSKR